MQDKIDKYNELIEWEEISKILARLDDVEGLAEFFEGAFIGESTYRQLAQRVINYIKGVSMEKVDIIYN